ncbi:MAG: GlxA family transcriptional regulator [Rhizobiaceae bacterium]
MTNSERGSIFRREDGTLHVTFLVLTGLSVMCTASAVDPLRAANRVTGARPFSWRFVSPDGRPATTTCGLPVAVDAPFDADACGDLLMIVAGFDIAAHATPALLAKVRRAARRVRAIGGVEAGPWLLARAGLLAGRAATTHWEDLEDFAAAFPGVDVRPDRYVIDGPVATTGGASPTFDLMLHLVRRRLGMAVALDVASVFIYDEAHGAGDAQPLVSLGRLDDADPRVAEAIRLMEGRIDSPLTVAAIARRLHLSARALEKLFGATVGETPGAYYLRLRLNVARRLVTDTRAPMADIAARTGFSSASAFSRAFARAHGTPPVAMRRSQTRSSATAMP